MSEKLQDNIERAPAEPHNEQLNREPFAWHLSFNREEKRRLNPTDRITASIFRADADYSGDFTEERKALRESTRAESSGRKADVGLTAAYNSLAFARHLNVVPAIEELEEAVVAPLEGQTRIETISKIESQIEKAEAAKSHAAKEKRLAELNKKLEEVDKLIEQRRISDTEKAQKKLEERFGPSWEARQMAVVSKAGKLATEGLVTTIDEPEEDVVKAKPIVVTRSVEDAEKDIAESNLEATDVDANQMDINHLADLGSGRVFGDSKERDERIALWTDEQAVEGSEVERFDDVQVDKNVIDRSEPQGTISDLDVMDAVESIEAKPRKRGFMNRAKDRAKDLGLALGVKLTTRNVNKTPEEKKSRKKVIVGIAIGAVAVGTALYLANQGDDNSRNFLADIWPFGNNGDSGNANEVATQTGGVTGSEAAPTDGTLFGPEVPDTTTVQPEQPISTPVDTAPQTPVVETFKGHEIQDVKLQQDGNIWENSEQLVDQAFPDLSPEEKLAKTAELKNLSLDASNLTELQATQMGVNQEYVQVQPKL